MYSAAIRSSSPVVTPGSSCSPTCAIVSATMLPAAAIFAISWADLRMIISLPGAYGIESALDLVGHVLDRPAGVQRHELPRRAVVLDDRLRLLVVDGEPALGRLDRVVAPPLYAGAAEHARLGGLVVEIEEEDDVERAADLLEQLVERPSLGEVARKPVEDEPLTRVVVGQALADHPDRELVGYEVAARHDLVHLAPERSRVVEGAEHVARRDVRDLAAAGDALGLRPLPRPLRAEHQDVHYLRKPS